MMTQMKYTQEEAFPNPLRQPFPFPIANMPQLIREGTIDACYASMAPDALVASCALAAVSLACQNFVDVERLPGLVGPCSLYITILANSGERKSYVDLLLTKPFHDFDNEQHERNNVKSANHKAKLNAWNIQCKAVLSDISKATKSNQSIEDLTHKLEELYSKKPEEPCYRQYIVNDSTAAELKYKLRHPFSSVGIFSDEGMLLVNSGLLRNFAIHNKLWDGGTVSVDRRTSESFRIANVRVTRSISIQPHLFFKHLCGGDSEALTGGYFARNLIAYPLSTIGQRFITQPRSSYPHLLNFQARITELLHFEHSAIETGTHTRRLLKFSGDAQQQWIKGFNRSEWLLAPGGNLSTISDFGSKLGDNVARIAGLFHYFEGHEGDEISLDTLLSAIEVATWYSNEYERIFSPTMPLLPQDQLDAITLENWLVKYFIEHRCTWIDKSDMERKATKSIRPVANLNPAISILIQRGIMANITTQPPPGRKPKLRFGLNIPYFEEAARLRPLWPA